MGDSELDNAFPIGHKVTDHRATEAFGSDGALLKQAPKKIYMLYITRPIDP